MTPFALFADVVDQVLTLSTEGLPRILLLPGIGSITLLIVALAGLSEAVGESVVLFANRVSRKRYLLSVLIAGVLFVFTYLFQAVSIFLVARYAFGSEVPLVTVATVVGLSYAPRMYGFLAFLPYFGNAVAALLTTWSVLAMVRGVAVALDFVGWQAVASVALGALLFTVLRRSVGLPLYWGARWLRRVGAGVEELITDPQELVERLVETADTLVDLPPLDESLPPLPEAAEEART